MDRECHYALVSQHLDNFTPKFQRQLLELAQTYCAIYEQPLEDFPESFHPLLDNLRNQYKQSAWQEAVDNIEQSTEDCAARVIPITSADYPISCDKLVVLRACSMLVAI